MFKTICALLKKYDKWVILSHTRPDADALCSVLAVASLLKEKNKQFRIILGSAIPVRYRFLIDDYRDLLLPEYLEVQPGQTLKDTLGDAFAAAPAIILDCSDAERVGHFSQELFDIKIRINIDHHKGNSSFGTINAVNPNAAATGELVYDLFSACNATITPSVADLLMLAIAGDSGWFSYENTSEKSHLIAVDLMKKGARLSYVRKHLEQFTLPVIHLLTRALNNVELDPRYGIALSILRIKDFTETKTTPNDTEGIIEMIRAIEGVIAAVFIREHVEGKFQISFRSNDGFDVSRIANQFDGGGHRGAAACRCSGDVDTVKTNILNALQEALPILKGE